MSEQERLDEWSRLSAEIDNLMIKFLPGKLTRDEAVAIHDGFLAIQGSDTTDPYSIKVIRSASESIMAALGSAIERKQQNEFGQLN